MITRIIRIIILLFFLVYIADILGKIGFNVDFKEMTNWIEWVILGLISLYVLIDVKIEK